LSVNVRSKSFSFFPSSVLNLKLGNTKWQDQTGQRLAVDVRAEKPNELVLLTESVFRSYLGTRDKLIGSNKGVCHRSVFRKLYWHER